MPEQSLSAVISHIAFFVANLERSTAFYRDVLAFVQIEEPFKIGMHSWFSLGEQCQLHLIAGAEQVPSFHINHHLAVRTAQFDAAVLRLTVNSITFYSPFMEPDTIHVRPDGIRQVFFQDPDGYWLELNDEPLPGAK